LRYAMELLWQPERSSCFRSIAAVANPCCSLCGFGGCSAPEPLALQRP
jgi:hypothetical protein